MSTDDVKTIRDLQDDLKTMSEVSQRKKDGRSWEFNEDKTSLLLHSFHRLVIFIVCVLFFAVRILLAAKTLSGRAILNLNRA